MQIPASAIQMMIALLFVVPGSVYQAVRQRLRGPAPDDLNFSNKLFRAIGVSTLLMAIYFACAGRWILALVGADDRHPPSWLGVERHVVKLGWATFALILGVPALLALLDYLRVAPKKFSLKDIAYEPIPRAWDFAFKDIEPCFIRILTTDGTWLGGWFGTRSFISGFPEPREMFIEIAHQMEEDGAIGIALPWSAGIYVRCDDVRSVELLRQPVASEEAKDGGSDGQ